MRIDGFDWDAGNIEKCARHGVEHDDIEALFARPHVIVPDVKHSVLEPRYLAVGSTGTGRPVLLVFTVRYPDGLLFIRPISARFMHKKEIDRYGRQESS